MSMNQTNQNEFEEPPDGALPEENAEIRTFSLGEGLESANTSEAEEVRRKHENKLMEIDGVEGVSVETGDLGEDTVVVFVRDESVLKKIPETLDGVSVRAEVTGEFDAFQGAVAEDVIAPSGAQPAAPPKVSKPTQKKTATATAPSSKPSGKRKTAATRSSPKGRTTRS